MLVEKLERITYEAGTRFARKGDSADGMYILYAGSVGIYLDGAEQTSTNIVLPAPKVIGESGLETKETRNADMGAYTDIKVLYVSKQIYERYIADPRKKQKFVNLRILKNIDFFKNWSMIRLQEFNSFLGEKNYAIGDVLYKQGAESSVFFVNVRGKLSAETEVEIDEYNRYPTNNKQWESVRTTTKYLYKLNDIKERQIFGHEELMDGHNREKTITALEETLVFYMNKNDFVN